MKALLLFLALASPMLPQITASPTSLDFIMRQGQNGPWNSTRYAENQTLTISGTGSWTATKGGALAGNFNVTPSSGTGPGTVTVTFIPLGSEELAEGIHTGSITIGSSTITVTLRAQPRYAYSAVVYRPGYPVGCVNTIPQFGYADTCTITDQRPTSTAIPPLANGATFVDPQFGGVMRRVSLNYSDVAYSNVRAISADNTRVMADSFGFTYIYSMANGSVLFGPLPAAVRQDRASWDGVSSDIIWYFEGPSIKSYTLSTGQSFTHATYSSVVGARPSFSSLWAGGTGDATSDNWWAFSEQGATNQYCAVNLNGLLPANQESQTYCIVTTGDTFSDFMLISHVDAATKKRYMLTMTEPLMRVYSIPSTGQILNFEYFVEQGGGAQLPTPHSDLGIDGGGNVILLFEYSEIYGNQMYLATMQLNKGAKAMRPVEEGGGLRFLLPITDNETRATHMGCSWNAPYCIWSATYNADLNAQQVTAVTAGSPCSLTTSGAHGFTTGASVQTANLAGITGATGIFTMTSTGATTMTLNGTTCSGTYTGSTTGTVADATAQGNARNRQQVWIIRLGDGSDSGGVYPVLTHRSQPYAGSLGVRASMSADGRFGVFAGNFGVPEFSGGRRYYLYSIDSGITPTTQRFTVGAAPADTSAVLNYLVPQSGQGAATVVISTSPSYTSPVINTTDGQTGQGRQFVATGLTASTRYFYRVTAGYWSAAGEFTTAAALSGSAPVQLSKGGGGTINYGATSGLGSSCSSPCSITATRGLLYTDLSGAASAMVVR